MDKKQQQYSRQGSSKALSSDSRKSSAELNSNKPWPKNSNRRENPNYSASKNDNQRGSKVDPAKNKPNVDKRPKARGGGTTNNYGGTAGQSLREDVPSAGAGLALQKDSNQFDYELHSVYAPGCKKQNLNHLLNFHFSQRDSDNYSGLNVFGKHGGNNNRSQVKKHKYNKEQYLQANFQFVVNWKANKKSTSYSPDTLIDWDLIEQINIQTTEEPQCPICLYPPVAAKLTRCGHAYCWPCILHYLALSDKTWRKCPICYEAIHTKDLKSTIIVQQVNFSVGSTINLHLMQRKKGSLTIEKFNSTHASESEEQFHMYSASDDESKFAKLLVANRLDVISIIEREQHELAFCEGEEDCPEFVFVQQAMDLLKARKLEINKEIDTNMEKKITENYDILKEKQPGSSDTETLQTKSVEDEHNAKYYYFYQSVDGQNIFLHPLNVKMLQACYGSLDKAPLIINANILQKEHHSMDEDHRRKFTCLGHLPLTCHFEIVEVQLGPPIISEDVLRSFKDDILQRKKARLRRDKEEKKREIKIDAINDRQMGKLLSSTANINLSSSHEFPSCGFEETLAAFPNEFHTDAIDIPVQPSTSKRNTYSSVANSIGSPKAEFWPTLRGAACSPNVSVDSTWSKESTAPRARMPSDRYSESDSLNEFAEEFHPAPNLGDVLAEAIIQKQHNTCRKNESASGGGGGGSKKSKKNKKMLLFSTGMNFHGK